MEKKKPTHYFPMYFLMPERTLKVAKTLNDTPKKEGLKYKYSMM